MQKLFWKITTFLKKYGGEIWQEVELSKYTSNTFFTGTRKLLGKQTIHSLQIHDGFLFAGGSSVDATAGKVYVNSSSRPKLCQYR